jgi:hypothetical protein
MHKARTLFSYCAGILCLALLLPLPATAAWPTDPAVNVPLCTVGSHQVDPTIVSDGAGGAIVAWADHRSGDYDIYAQRIAADGTVRWTTNGVALCTADDSQYRPMIVSDDLGGAIVIWTDARSGSLSPDIYAQRVSASGTVEWTTNGVAICTAVREQRGSTVVSDGAGGVVVAWEDFRSYNCDIYAQRISASGTTQWMANGVPFCMNPDHQYRPSIASDAAGGAIVTWMDCRSGSFDIYAQRISGSGVVQWTADGVALCVAAHSQYDPKIVSDGSGGAIATWFDERRGYANPSFYAQRISGSGVAQWTADGVALCTASGNRRDPAITSDSAGGAIVTWYDYRSDSVYADIYAQRISGNGTPQWTLDGVALCTDSGNQAIVAIAPDGRGGAFVAWQDGRGDDGYVFDIYAQHVSSTGVPQWTADGVALCTAANSQYSPTIISDGAGGVIAAWSDCRSDPADIYAQNLNADGTLGPPAPTPVLLSFLAAEASGDSILLTWFVDGTNGAAATVYRSFGGDEWVPIGEVMADGTGYLRYTDYTHVTVDRVGYRLGVLDAGIEGFYGEAWVDLPDLALALHPVPPHPSRDGVLAVHFTLPNATAASLHLIDVAGRMIVSREVGSLGAGRHTLDLSEGRRLSPGVYLVRLQQGADSRVMRAVVLK